VAKSRVRSSDTPSIRSPKAKSSLKWQQVGSNSLAPRDRHGETRERLPPPSTQHYEPERPLPPSAAAAASSASSPEERQQQQQQQQPQRDQPLFRFGAEPQVVLENFYRLFEPEKTANQIQRDLEKADFEKQCFLCERRYNHDPRKLWVKPNHGHNAKIASPRAKSATRQRDFDPTSGNWFYGSDGDTGEVRRAQGSRTTKKQPTGLVLREKHVEEAKKKMKNAFYTTKPNRVTRRKIEKELEMAGFKGGIDAATDEQIEQAKRNIIFAPGEVDLSGPSWIE